MVAPRVYHGEYTLQETVILTQLNLNMQARDLERMKQILRNGGDVMMCSNEQAAPWCLVLTGNTTAATESEAATLKLPDVAADVFPTIHPSL